MGSYIIWCTNIMCVVFLHMDHAKGNITFNFNFIETDNLDKQHTQKCQKQLTVQLQNCSFRYMMCKLLHPVFPEDKRHLSIDNSSSTGNQFVCFFLGFFSIWRCCYNWWDPQKQAACADHENMVPSVSAVLWSQAWDNLLILEHSNIWTKWWESKNLIFNKYGIILPLSG